MISTSLIIEAYEAEIVEKQRRIELMKSYVPREMWQLIRINRGRSEWTDCIPNWDFERFDYRKKPEPAVCYRNQYDGGFCGEYDTPEEAQKGADVAHAIRVAVKFVEEI